MQTLTEQQDFLRRKKVVVKFEHLPPLAQKIIGRSAKLDFDPNIPLREVRSWRLWAEAGFIPVAVPLVLDPEHSAIVIPP